MPKITRRIRASSFVVTWCTLSGLSCQRLFSPRANAFQRLSSVNLCLRLLGDVVGVLTLLVGGVAQAFHDDRVVELRVQLGVQEVEVEREKRVKEGAPWMVWRWL